ncbi:hypothetical protein ANN_26352 [Periplaneta americana]|uniref:Uncharacterized protein n=1 Tax=Periplaneta americana TaxID=6978 RepID=A0ABQ8S644_PERAM|nr:hypothetical protein ANN_26352 [Periplaneta americana]
MSSHEPHGGVQVKVRERYESAHFIHFYAHQLNLIVERCVTGNKQVRIFFSNLEGISSFFSQSPKRAAVLDEVVKKRIPSCPQSIRWNFKSRCVTIAHKFKQRVVECVGKIIDDESNDYKTLNKATGMKSFLKDNDFLFWFDLFNKTMPHCDILFNVICLINDHLSTAKLFEPSLFPRHSIAFPDNELKIAVGLFNLNPKELRHELNVLYGRTEFVKASGALTLLNCLYEHNLVNAFSESVKLLKIIVTIPMTPERQNGASLL